MKHLKEKNFLSYLKRVRKKSAGALACILAGLFLVQAPIELIYAAQPLASKVAETSPPATQAPTAQPSATHAPTAQPEATPAPTAQPGATPAPMPSPEATPENGIQPSPEATQLPEGTTETPLASTTPIPKASPTPTPLPKSKRNTKKDWTKDTENLKLSIEKLSYQNKKTTVSANGLILDISDAEASDIETMTMEVGFDFLRTDAVSDIIGGDTFSITLPKEYFHITNSQDTDNRKEQIIKSYKKDKYYEQEAYQGEFGIATYEIKDNTVSVVFDVDAADKIKNMNSDELFGIISLDVALSKEALNSEHVTEAELMLQPEQKTVIILPKAEEGSTVSGNEGSLSDNMADDTNSEDRVLGLNRSVSIYSARVGDTNAGKKYTATIKNPQDGIERVKIIMINNEGGYQKDQYPSPVSFAMDIKLNDDYLLEKLEQIEKNDPTNYPRQGLIESHEDFEKRLEQYLRDNLPSSEQLVYTYSFGEYFKYADQVRDGAASPKGKLTSGTEELGEWEIIADANGNCQLKVTYAKEIYLYHGVNAGLSFNLNVDTSKLKENEDFIVKWEKEDIVWESLTSPGGPTDPAKPQYSVKKDADSVVKTSTVEYTIDLSADVPTKFLDTMWLEDSIPSGLIVESVMLDGFELTEGTGGYQIKNEKLLYQFPAGKNTQNASFTIKMRLDDATYERLIKDGKLDQTFKNKASLKATETGPGLVESEEVSTNMKVVFIKKDGEQKNANGTKYVWSVEVNSNIYGVKENTEFLVDTINWDSHTYDKEFGVKISGDENTLIKPLADITDILKTDGILNADGEFTVDSYAYLQLDVAKLSALNAKTAAKAFYYVYKDAMGANQAVMVVPFKDYLGKNGTNKDIKIEYETNINLGGKTLEKYLEDKLNDPAAAAKEVGNEVMLLWEKQNGSGPGPNPPPPDEWDIKKGVAENLEPASKAMLKYNEKTQMLTWKFSVNYCLANMKNVVLTDTFDPLKQELSANPIINYETLDGNEGTIPEKSGVNPPPYYEISGNDLKIVLGDLSVKDRYDIWFDVKIVDPAILAMQGAQIAVGNKVKVEWDFGGTTLERDITAEGKVPNTWIKKAAVGAYNYNTHELKWKVTINQNNISVDNGKVIDTLPAGNTFVSLDKLVVVGSTGNREEHDVTAIENTNRSTSTPTGKTISWNSPVSKQVLAENGKNYATDEATFTLPDPAGDTYELYLTSKVSDADYRKDLLGASADGTVNVKNNVQLTGTVAGTAIDVSAKAEAPNTIRHEMTSKGGVYNPEEAKIDWTVFLNKDQIDMSGMTLNEILQPALEMANANKGVAADTESVRVYYMPMNADGTLGAAIDMTAESAIENALIITGRGFDFTIPSGAISAVVGADYQTATYKLTFTTYLTEVLAENPEIKISNKVILKTAGATDKPSNDSNGGYTEDFDFEDYISGTKRPALRLVKHSSNSTDAADDPTKWILLEGAEFDLTAYNYSATTIGAENTAYSKTAVSNADGVAGFMNLQKSTNAGGIVYELKERKAPAGYDIDNNPQYFRFTDSITPDVGASTDFTKGGNSITVNNISKNADGAYPVADVAHLLNFKNKPKSGVELHLVKQVPSELNPDGTVKTYAQITGGADREVTFSIERQGISSTHIDVTSVNGKLTFENLDPGSYKLVEIKSPTGLSTGGEFMLEVTVDQVTGNYLFELKAAPANNNGLSVMADKLPAGDTGIIKNDLSRGSFSFQKKAAYADTYKENLAGIKFTLSGTPDCAVSGAVNYSVNKVTAADGEIAFDNIPPGIYELTETRKAGYEELEGPSGQTYHYAVIVTENTKIAETEKQTVTVKITDKDGLEVTLGEGNVITEGISNTPIKGSIQFQKTGLGSINLDGAKFGLFRKAEDIVPVYEAISGGNALSGTVKFENVEFGDYILKEITPPPGYVDFKTAITITKANIIVQDIVNFGADGKSTPNKFQYYVNYNAATAATGEINNELPTLVMYKKDQNNTAVAGASFELTGIFADNTAVATKNLVSEANGQLVLATGGDNSLKNIILAGNDYILKETATIDNHLSMLADVKIQVGSDKKITASLVNPTTADITAEQVFKISTDGFSLTLINLNVLGFVELTKVKKGSSIAVGGAEFTLYREAEGSETAPKEIYSGVTTDAFGKWKLAEVPVANINPDTTKPLRQGLKQGKYYFIETAAPPEYHKHDNTDKLGKFEIEAPIGMESQMENVKIENDPFEATLIIPKKDAWSKEALEEAVFKLYWQENIGATLPGSWTELTTLTTKNDGRIEYKIPKKGHYKLEEQPKTGYLVSSAGNTDPFTAEFTVGSEDYRKTLTVKKDDSSLTDFDFADKTSVTNQNILTPDGIINRRLPGELTIQKRDAATGDAPADITGQGLEAEFKIYNRNGNRKGSLLFTVVTGKNYTSTATDKNGPFALNDSAGTHGDLKIENMPWGDYYLEESVPPVGFVGITEDIPFSINAGSLSKAFTLTEAIGNNKTSFTLSKTALDGVTGLTGAAFTLETCNPDGSYTKIFDTTTDADTWLLTGLLVVGNTYRLTETKSKDGYELPLEPVIFKLTKKGEPEIISGSYAVQSANKKGLIVKNEPLAFSLNKVTSALPMGIVAGSEFTITGKFQGDTLATSITAAAEAMRKAVSSRLVQGEIYTLEEIKAPAGYKLAEGKLRFTIDQNGKLSFTGTIPKFVKLMGDDTIQIADEPIELLLKKRSPEGKLLPGCVFEVSGVFAPAPAAGKATAWLFGRRAVLPMPIFKEAAAGVVESIIVDDANPNALQGRLIIGNTYILKEKNPPSGYEIGGDVKFTVLEDSGAIKFSMEISGEYTLTQDSSTGEFLITMVDDPVEVEIEKTDSSGRPISGSVFKLTGVFADGSTEMMIEPLAEKPVDLVEILNESTAGETLYEYTLTEVQPPSGYEKLKDPIVFKITNGGVLELISHTADEMVKVSEARDVYKLTVQNREIKSSGSSSGSSDSSGNSQVLDSAVSPIFTLPIIGPIARAIAPAQTGDNILPVLAALLALLAAGGALIYIKKKK